GNVQAPSKLKLEFQRSILLRTHLAFFLFFRLILCSNSRHSMRKTFRYFLGLATLAVFSCTAIAAPLDHAVLNRMDTQINTAITQKKLPGAVIWVERDGDIYH